MANIIKLEQAFMPTLQKKRAAAYTRVSEEGDIPMHSLSNQISYYSSLIQNTPEWEYAGVYADEGLSGYTVRKRDEFRRLISDCDAGKIDIILVKSISRFARNTVDLLNTVRHLKEIGVEVRFERENISTFSGDGELLLTLLASFAQEESRSISENIRWATKKRFEQGIPNGHKAPFGYEWDGEMFRIIPEQGETVKEIYRRYLDGESAHAIAKSLAERGITGQTGTPIEDTTVKNILSSESYMGTMLLQKTFTSEDRKTKRNCGELPQYAVEEMFEPLVTAAEFEKARDIMRQRADAMPNKNAKLTAFSGIVKCGNCGSSVSRRTVKNGKKWVCNTKERKGKEICDMRPVTESELMQSACEALCMDSYSGDAVRERVARITIHGDRIEFSMKNGRVKNAARRYGGYKRRSGFSGKIKCRICGGSCECDSWRLGHEGQKEKVKVWICPSGRERCSLHRIMEGELRRAAESFFGGGYEAAFVQEIREVAADNEKLDFIFKDGMVKTWQRE